MNIDKAKKLAFEYSYYYQEMLPEYEADRFFANAIRPEVHEAINHIIWMANEIQTFDSLDKVMRWLGFIQGCMWVLGSKSISELKTDSLDNLGTEYEPPPNPLEYSIDELAEAYNLYYDYSR